MLRQLISFTALALALGASAQAQTAPAAAYPGTKPVRLIVPFPPGGGTDTGARLLAQRLTEMWGKAVVIENKPGAAGQIGSDYVARAKPDGYTLLMGNIGTHSINPSLYKAQPYDAVKSFAPVSLVAELPQIMVTALICLQRKMAMKMLPGYVYKSSGETAACMMPGIISRSISFKPGRFLKEMETGTVTGLLQVFTRMQERAAIYSLT